MAKKILELFEARHNKGKMYRETPMNKAHGVNRIKEAGDGHPLHYVYPDGVATPTGRQHMNLMDSVKDDVVLAEGSVSHLRDTSRILQFERTNAGARFLEQQILLQRSNPWAQTRQYRKDNITDHTDPTIHKQRHGAEASVSSALSSAFEIPFLGKIQAGIPGEFAIQLNSGKLQEETVNRIIDILPKKKQAMYQPIEKPMPKKEVMGARRKLVVTIQDMINDETIKIEDIIYLLAFLLVYNIFDG